MEEEKKIPEETVSELPSEEKRDPSAAEEVGAEPISEADVGALNKEAPASEEEHPVAEPPLAWDFGKGDAVPEVSVSEKKKTGMGGFFAIFGTVFGICALLLVLTLWLGDAGFEIIRNIKTERVVYVREDDGTSGLLTPNEAAAVGAQSTVTISVKTALGTGIGSGFVYSEDGYICTNYHVIESQESVQVVLASGEVYDAQVVGYNADADVAILKIEASDLVAAEFASSADLLVGDEVVAIGTPAKLDYAGTATFGSVSATNRLLALTDTEGNVVKKMTVIQTDTSVNPGNSGGPLVDMYGKVVGVVVMKVSYYGGSYYDGIGFALPIDGVREIADEIIKKGFFTGTNPIAQGRSLLGITAHGGEKGKWYADADGTPYAGVVDDSAVTLPGYHRFAEDGVYVIEVSDGDAMGKIQVGDLILKINGLRATTTTDIIGEVNRHYAGETVTLTILREGERLDIKVRLYEGGIS